MVTRIWNWMRISSRSLRRTRVEHHVEAVGRCWFYSINSTTVAAFCAGMGDDQRLGIIVNDGPPYHRIFGTMSGFSSSNAVPPSFWSSTLKSRTRHPSELPPSAVIISLFMHGDRSRPISSSQRRIELTRTARYRCRARHSRSRHWRRYRRRRRGSPCQPPCRRSHTR